MKQDDTEKIPTGTHVCLDHSGVCKDVKHIMINIQELWKAVGQIRTMFAVTMLSAVGSLATILWAVLSKKVGL